MNDKVADWVNAGRELFFGCELSRDLHDFIFNDVSQSQRLKQNLEGTPERDTAELQRHGLVCSKTIVEQCLLVDDDRNLVLVRKEQSDVTQWGVDEVDFSALAEFFLDSLFRRAVPLQVDRGPLLTRFSECSPNFCRWPADWRFVRERNVRKFNLVESF